MSGKTYLNSQTYFKPNYFEALDYIVPNLYKEEDLATFGKEDDLVDVLINEHIDFASSVSSVLFISAVEYTSYSSMDTLEGIAPYFVKQNNLSFLTTERFETKILNRVGKSFSDFKTSGSFADYLEDELLPSIAINAPTSSFHLTDAPSATHNYLIENLSWLYFLNTSAATYDPSSFVKNILVEKTYAGEPIALNDCMKGLSEFIWRNDLAYYPSATFASAGGEFTSGTQQLDNLQTWMDVIYSPLYADRSDFTVRDKFDTFITADLQTTDKIPAGPFSRLLRAISFAAFDMSSDTDLLETVYDIDDCPDEFLPLLADLIGWDLFGSNPERWRLQLKNAVEVYKKVGTKQSVQFALNTVFPKDIFSIESRITELWESYIPFLIHYSLATESVYFESFQNWYPDIAAYMNVVGYSASSMDDNVKHATDRILYETFLKFPEAFNIPNQEDGFRYRGKVYPIPPFEEYPYYVNVEMTKEMLDFITDRLVCFGVNQLFAFQFKDFVTTNALEVDEEPRTSSWLLFTSGYNSPPNLNNLILNLNNKNFEYASLWSGKSSHFKLVFDASEFDFTKKNSDDIDSGDAVVLASKVLNSFVPAHSIPLVSLTLSTVDYINFQSSAMPMVMPSVDEADGGSYCRNWITSGISISSFKRGLGGAAGSFSRKDLVSRMDPLYTNASNNASNLSRYSLRRRSYEKLAPKNGYYDRTGFNMPTSHYMLSGLSGIPLGFIPSSLSFESIPDHVNLPAVYSVCQGINSSSTFYGYTVSDALIGRGHTGLGLVDWHNDRCQLPEFYAIIHSLKEDIKYWEASAAYGSATTEALEVRNVYQAYANSATESDGWFPESVNDFYNFGFGKEFHLFYKDYTTHFARHQLSDHMHYQDGANIYSHTFGPLLYNSEFDTLGAAGFVTASLSALDNLNNKNGFQASSAGVYIASSSDDMYVDTFEYVNSGIIDAVELIQTSGISEDNGFQVFKIDPVGKSSTDDDYMYNRTFIQNRSLDGFGRIRMDMKKHSSPASYPITENFLLPEHKFEVDAKLLVTELKGQKFGDRTIGVWVHTKPELGRMWSLNQDGFWVQHPAIIKQDEVVSYSTLFHLPLREKTQEELEEEATTFECIYLANNTVLSSSPIVGIKEADFQNLKFTFTTDNRQQILNNEYLKAFGQLHRKDQSYVVELFMIPNSAKPKQFMLLDSIKMQDLTLKQRSEVIAVDDCYPIRVPTSKSQVQGIFKFWNKIVGGAGALRGQASRVANDSDHPYLIADTNGSRADYRQFIESYSRVQIAFASVGYPAALDEVEVLV